MAFIENIKKGYAYRVLVGQDPTTSQNIYDRRSLWTHADDVSFADGTTLSARDSYATGTLLAGSSTVTVVGSNITVNGMLDIYVPSEDCGVCVKKVISQVNGSVTLEFPVQDHNMEVRVFCKKGELARNTDTVRLSSASTSFIPDVVS